MFETDRLPLGWLRRYHEMDEIWFPATFFGDVLARAGVVRSKMRAAAVWTPICTNQAQCP
jgi:hypothetical protein